MRNLIVVISVFALRTATLAQDVVNMDGVNCGMHGSSTPERKEYGLNAYKNRYNLPRISDFATNITIDDLINGSDSTDFPQRKAVILTGYVYNVKEGGIESCNCKTKDILYRDTHIEIVPDENHTAPKYRIIVEVTPRMRAYMNVHGKDWSTATLKHQLIGHHIKVAGWLFFDAEHTSQAYVNNPGNVRDWRASCWEIHPITAIKVCD